LGYNKQRCSSKSSCVLHTILITLQGPEIAHLLEAQADDRPDPSSIYQGRSGLRDWDCSEASAIRSLRKEVLEYDSLHSMVQIIDNLPPRETCDRLWAVFITTVYPLIPILHLPTFYSQYDEFWQSVEEFHQTRLPRGFLVTCPTFLALLLSALCCGSLHSYLNRSRTDGDILGPTVSESRRSEMLSRTTMRALTMLGFPRDPTIYSLAAFVIWHVPLIREESEQSTAFISTAFRAGQALGLHRDPSHFGITDAEAEVRRRLWWHILHKDTRMLSF
jgi:hypothetical protein